MNAPAIPRYNVKETEAKWQASWEREGAFKAELQASAPKYYVLEMFPYPSGHIHMGHVRNYTLGDVMARFKRSQGFNVLQPMGWDAFGLPAENAAIERNTHPATWTYANIDAMRAQLKTIGLSYDWSREIATCSPDYYKFEQYFFLQFLKHGIAYRKEAYVNWDPVDNTVLANEQVIDGRGWRSGAPVERRKLSQWFLKISDYAEELLTALDGLKDWPEKVRLMQERWIGKSYGATLKLEITGGQGGEVLDIYTTRPDTIFGMSFCAISPNHPLAARLAENNPAMAAFIEECNRLGTSEESIEKAEKKGLDTGLRIRHPLEDREVPLYVANFVLMDYGTGAIFGCPAHDQRDFEFATKYNLPILPVVGPDGQAQPLTESYTGPGILINSQFLNGLGVEEAKKRAIAALEAKGQGAAKINYRLRDWGVSRQRYWGCPIPIIYCDSCGAVPVPEKDLPVKLPEDVTFDKPGNPLDHHRTWKHVNCPACGKAARRETDTFDTFFESSWYFGRYTAPHAPTAFDQQALAYWMPVDCYIGGIEHAVLHLLYSRFFTRALKTCGLMPCEEPFKRLETQGMICHETYKSPEGKWLTPDEIVKASDGTAKMQASGASVTVGRVEKMSKSKRNTIDPTHIITSYGADAARLFMLSDSPPERDLEWTDAGIEGAWRYINRLWKLMQPHRSLFEGAGEAADITGDLLKTRQLLHRTIAAVTQDIEAFHFNKAVARIRELTNALEEVSPDNQAARALLCEAFPVVLALIQPFMPHIAAELAEQLDIPQCLSTWPKADPALTAQETVTVAVQISGKMKGTIELPKDAPNDAAEAAARALPAAADAISGKEIIRVVVVPNRIVNIVVK